MQKITKNHAKSCFSVKIHKSKSTKSILTNINMMSVNQLNAHIKLTEIWKAVIQVNYPITVTKYKINKS